jgi:hypothetical protein
MEQLLTLFRGSGAPPARLDHARFSLALSLDLTELMIFAIMVGLLPLIFWGIHLPEPFHLLAIACFPAMAALLFLVKHEDHHLLYWLGRMLPYWTRQRVFRPTITSAWRVSPANERLDALVLGGENALSFRWLTGADGRDELHIYESPLRPYRAWVAAGGQPSSVSAMAAGVLA